MAVAAGFAIIRYWDAVVGEVAVPERDGAANYDNAIIRVGVVLSTFWGVVGFLVGLVLALQLAYPALNFDLPWTNFGRLRPLHTSAVIFAFGGTVLLTTSFHVVQRTCRTRCLCPLELSH